MAYIPPRIAIYSLMIGCVIVKQVKISDMKISEVIKKLQEIQAYKGDINVVVSNTEEPSSLEEGNFSVYTNWLQIEF